jgi:hypothetical protein
MITHSRCRSLELPWTLQELPCNLVSFILLAGGSQLELRIHQVGPPHLAHALRPQIGGRELQQFTPDPVGLITPLSPLVRIPHCKCLIGGETDIPEV